MIGLSGGNVRSVSLMIGLSGGNVRSVSPESYFQLKLSRADGWTLFSLSWLIMTLNFLVLLVVRKRHFMGTR